MLAAAAAQHARGVRQMRETGRWPVAGGSVSMPIGLGLAVAPGEAVSAGPVWQHTHWLLADGVLKGTGPQIAAAAPFTVVERWRRDSIPMPAQTIMGVWTSTSVYFRMEADRFSQAVALLANGSYQSVAERAGAGTGVNVQSGGLTAGVGAWVAVDGSALANGSSGWTSLGTSTLYYAAVRGASTAAPGTAGIYHGEMGVFLGQALTEADLDALWNNGTPTDWQPIATARGLTLAPYYDPSNAIAVGSTLEIPDITGTYGPIVVSSADLGDLVGV